MSISLDTFGVARRAAPPIDFTGAHAPTTQDAQASPTYRK
jgi:hypothetical protein